MFLLGGKAIESPLQSFTSPPSLILIHLNFFHCFEFLFSLLIIVESQNFLFPCELPRLDQRSIFSFSKTLIVSLSASSLGTYAMGDLVGLTLMEGSLGYGSLTILAFESTQSVYDFNVIQFYFPNKTNLSSSTMCPLYHIIIIDPFGYDKLL